MPSSHTIVGIDIGTSKVVVTVAEPNSAGVPRVVGAGMSRTRGMRAGAIVSFDDVAQAVAAAVSQAETTSGRQITSAWVTFSGDHVACENASGGTTLTNHPHDIHEILDPDIHKALAAARPSPTEIGREVVLVELGLADDEKRVLGDGDTRLYCFDIELKNDRAGWFHLGAVGVDGGAHDGDGSHVVLGRLSGGVHAVQDVLNVHVSISS